jgi:hypothetical protein
VTATSAGTGYDDLLLGQPLPHQGPGPPLRLAAELDTVADRCGRLAARVGALAPTRGWSGVAAAAADVRVTGCAAVLQLEQLRARRAADALRAFARDVVRAQEVGEEARRTVAAARETQRRADAAAPAEARQRDATAGRRLDGGLYAPEAVVLLHRARASAVTCCRIHDDAVQELILRLTALSGLRVVRRTGDLHLALDVVSMVPGPGDVVGLLVGGYDVFTGVRDGDWAKVAATGLTSIPGPVGRVATAVGVGITVARLGSVARIDRVPTVVPVVDARRPRAAPAGPGVRGTGRDRVGYGRRP